MVVPEGTIASMGSTFLSTGATSEYTSTGDSYTYTYGESTSSSVEKRVRIQGNVSLVMWVFKVNSFFYINDDYTSFTISGVLKGSVSVI